MRLKRSCSALEMIKLLDLMDTMIVSSNLLEVWLVQMSLLL